MGALDAQKLIKNAVILPLSPERVKEVVADIRMQASVERRAENKEFLIRIANLLSQAIPTTQA